MRIKVDKNKIVSFLITALCELVFFVAFREVFGYYYGIKALFLAFIS